MIPPLRLSSLESRMARLMKVPPPPELLTGGGGSTQVFRAAPGFYAYQLVKWGLGQIGALLGLVAGQFILPAIVPDVAFWGLKLHAIMEIFEVLAFVSYLIQVPITFLAIRLDYRMRWYLVTDQGLRIREGIWLVKEQTMTFSNVQNMAIRQGPFQRLLGIQDLEVSTAGGGEASAGKEHGRHTGIADIHLACIRGVENAREIRDAILEHLRLLKGAGLGDPDDRDTFSSLQPSAANAPASIEAARALLQEVRALRQVFD